MKRYTREEAIQVLVVAKAKMDAAQTKDETLAVLREAGGEVAYTPAFRCLVMGQEPKESFRWE